MTSGNDTMSLRINDKGARLPYWVLGAAFTAIVFVVGLAVESRLRLATLGDDLKEVKQAASKVQVIEHRVGALEQRSAAAKLREAELSRELQQLQRSVIAICVKLGADCPGTR